MNSDKMDLKEAENEFLKLLDKMKGKDIPDFLEWINESFTTKAPPTDAELVAEEEASLQDIIGELRQKVPVNAILPSERTLWPEYGIESDCKEPTTVHVDGFLYDDDEVDDLVEQGLLSREYCRACGSRGTAPLTFISHSLSRDQLRYMFKALLPPEILSGKTVVDVGSRIGAVLFSGFLYSSKAKFVGVEMNEELCGVQWEVIQNREGMSERVAVVCDDIRNRGDIVQQADVVVLNNVFQFFLPPQDQVLCWNFLHQNIKKGAVLITCPSLESLTGHLNGLLDFKLSDWAQKIPTDVTAGKFAGNDAELFPELEKLCLYQVPN